MVKISKNERRIMQRGSGARFELLMSAFESSGKNTEPSDAECLEQIERAAALLAAARPDKKYKKSWSHFGEDHYGYLYRLFRFQRALISRQIRETAYTFADLIASAGETIFQPRVLYATLATVTPETLEKLREVCYETAMENRQGDEPSIT